ncbi:putative folylpolyglutamate synthase [Scaptodrosophila lebanonensis]|uniref:Folylpolyglutamate synthase n=1 Tax=Drosophila lebanonensis TaxID=7225 RepID=A0A6J2TU81_DROLE|nr:putative folylpolyglutamate synthase [Scaptodrosophila lebanonensis]
MTVIRLLNSVHKNTKPSLRAFLLRMNDIKQHIRNLVTIPPSSTPTHASSSSSSSSHFTMLSQLPFRICQEQLSNASPFEDLVLYPKGRSNDDKNSEVNAAFETAIQELNKLQPNEQTIRRSVENPKINTVKDTVKYLERSGLPLNVVEQLSFIHVSGTKGKGSTCALVESILRQYGARTGFFSSPHVLATNERIRIDGEPLAKQKFVNYFWPVYKRLMAKRENETDMPAYFKFLTILSFHVFVEENVDVAVMEVGIGGEQDCTNVLRNVRTVGITSLGLEHTELLGNTMEQIAWQKAGIIKPYSHVYTHVTQPECLKVIRDRALEKQATVHEVPAFEQYFKHNLYEDYWPTFNEVIRLNGSLAIQLAYDWLRQTPSTLHRRYPINEPRMCDEVFLGLRNCHWPGRCQLVQFQGMRLHLDGAHTKESMRVCTDWFWKSTSDSNNPKILIFNRTGDSDPMPMLKMLSEKCTFDMICFVPNVATVKGINPNQVMIRSSAEVQLKRAHAIARSWDEMCNATNQINNSRVYSTVYDAFSAIRERFSINNHELDVLITGSIHLLGATIAALNEFHIKAIPVNGHQ